MPFRIGLVALLIALSPALPAAAASPAGAAVRVTHAWIRWLPGGVPLAGYAVLENPSEGAVVLTHASSPAFGEIDLHRTAEHAGTMSMTPVDRLTLAPHETLDLEARGYHLMLMQPKRALAPGERVPITLYFADGSTVTAEFEVRAGG